MFKLSRKTKNAIGRAASVVVYAIAVSVYGYFNYCQGYDKTWDDITDSLNTADKNAVLLRNDNGQEYIAFDAETSKKIIDKYYEQNKNQQN